MPRFRPLTLFFLSALTGAIGQTHPATTPQFLIHDAGQPRRFTLVTSQLSLKHGESRQLIDTPATDPASLKSAARTARSRPGQPEVELILVEDRRDPADPLARRYVTRRIHVVLDDPAAAVQIAQSTGLRLAGRPSFAPASAILEAPTSEDALDAMETLRALPGVKSADVLLAHQHTLRSTLNDPVYGTQWHLENTTQLGGALWIDANLPKAWETATGRNVTIAIVDDGLQYTHPDLAPRYNATIDYDFNGNDTDPSPTTSNRHGTACAGLAAAAGNNSIGVAGTAWEAALAGLRLIAADTTDEQDAAAFSHHNEIIQIYSNSWGPGDGADYIGPDVLATAALANGTASGRGGKGSIYVFAGGNGLDSLDNANADGYANSIHTIAVSAVNDYGFQSYYSEPGACILIAAPSGGGLHNAGIATTDLLGASGYNNGTSGDLADDDYTATFSGTSAACPLVAGVCALLLEANPNLGWRDVREILLTSARRIHAGDPDWAANGAGLWFNHKYGAGLVDAAAALALAQQWTNLGPQANLTVSQTNINQSIPDNNTSGVTRTFNFATPGFRVEHAVLTANLTHSRTGNLAFTLTSPSGTQSILMQPRPYDNNADITDWPFMSVHHWGESAAGNWTVNIADRNSGDTGTLKSLKLTLYGTNNATSRAVAGNATLLSESNLPANNAIDPGERVTVNLPLKNAGSTPLGNLTATLLDTGTLTPVTLSQIYGALAPGATANRSFSFRPSRAGSGTAANPILRLSDNGTPIGHAAFSLPLGTFSNPSFNGASITIRDDNTASPYPSTLNVSGLSGRVHHFSVSLNNLTHPYLYDVGVLLNSPASMQIVLFDNAPDSAVSSITPTFDDLASLYFPVAGASPTNSYRPVSFFNPAGFTSLPDDELGYTLGEFLGLNPNGSWRLYIEDFTSASTAGSLNSWTLNFRTNNCTDNLLFLDNATSAPEGANATLTVWRTAGREGNASVQYATLNGTATAGQDFTPVSGNLTFLPGETAQTLAIPLLTDNLTEGNQTFTVRLSSASGNSTLGNASSTNATVTITDVLSQTPFESWASSHGLTGNNASTDAILQPDGLTNAEKFAFGLDPTTFDRTPYQLDVTTPGLPFAQFNGTSTLTLEFLRRSGATYTPQKSPSLAPPSWSNFTGTPSITPVNATWERLRYDEPIDPSSTPAQFFTLNITVD